MQLDALSRAALDAAVAGGREALQGFGRQMRIETKSSPTDLVTEYDRKSQDKIVEALSEKFPDHGFLGEEDLESALSADYLWVIDPIDGTTNFAHHSPIFAVSVGLLHHNEPVVGVVHAPAMGETFAAIKGQGATLNGEPIHVSATSELSNAVLATGFFPHENMIRRNLGHFSEFIFRTRALRRLGSAALDLCWVAMGRFDGFWELGLNPWDATAGRLIVTEAGGRVTDYAGGEYGPRTDNLLCSNGRIHEQMMAILAKAPPPSTSLGKPSR